jgi:hypothetical protein
MENLETYLKNLHEVMVATKHIEQDDWSGSLFIRLKGEVPSSAFLYVTPGWVYLNSEGNLPVTIDFELTDTDGEAHFSEEVPIELTGNLAVDCEECIRIIEEYMANKGLLPEGGN